LVFRFYFSDAYATITRYPNNPSHSLGNYIEGQRIGDIYGYETIGIAKSQEEMDAHIAKVDQSTIDNNKWGAGDIMYRDLNNDGKISPGANTLEDHGDLKKIGNSTPRYLFGIDLNAAWKGFDVRCFFQGVMKREYWASTRYFFGTFEYGRWYQVCLDGLQDYYRDEKFEELINERTKGILICNPNNPTGYLYTRREMNQIRDLVKKYDLFLFSDEVYREFIYTGSPYISACHLEGIENNVVLIDSVSKRYSECGIRIGALITKNKEVRDAVMKFRQ
jgi:hypothetical protein